MLDLSLALVNRAVAFFVMFCLLLAVLGAVIAWWLGPHLVSLAFDSKRASEPFYSLYLQHQSGSVPGSSEQATQAENGYNVRLLQLLAHPVEAAPGDIGSSDSDKGVGAQPNLGAVPSTAPVAIVWQTSSLSVLAGAVADEWSNLLVARFNTGRQFVRLVTSPEYRDVRNQAPGGRRVVVGSSTAPLRGLRHPAALLLLVEEGAPEALDAWVDELVAMGGEVVWDAPVAVLEAGGRGAADWDGLLLVGFPDAQALAAWSFSVEAQTTNALLGAKAQALNLWLLQGLR